jgi:hypothetical protein
VSLEEDFPNLGNTGYRITSPASTEYNCIAWAARDDSRWWEPDPFYLYFWPEGAPHELTIDAVVQAYTTLGFVPCQTSEVEPGVEKIAIYVDSNGTPTHAARQLPSGKWTSKLGQSEDIEHELNGLTNSKYGSVARILKRPVSRTSSK